MFKNVSAYNEEIPWDDALLESAKNSDETFKEEYVITNPSVDINTPGLYVVENNFALTKDITWRSPKTEGYATIGKA